MKKLCLFLLFFGIVFFVFGQNQTPSKINLPLALDEAAKNYPSIKAKLAEKNSSSFYLNAAKTEYLPDVVLQHQYNFGTDNSVNGAISPLEGAVPSVSGGIRKDNIFEPVWGSFTGLQVNWKAFTFGKIRANINVAQKAVERQKVEYENEVFQQQIRVSDAYLALLVFQKIVTIQAVNLQRTKTFRDVINANVKAGLRAGIDSSFANAEVSKAKLLLLQSQQNEKSQRIRLGELLGRSMGDILVDSMQFYQKIPQILSKNNDFLQNPLLKIYRSQIDFINARAFAIKKSYLPTINLNALYWGRGSGINNVTGEYNSSIGAGVGYQVSNYLVGLGIRWNLTPIYRIRAEVNAELQRSEQFQALLNEQELHLERQTENATMQIELAMQQANESPIQTIAAMGSFRQATARYESGLATLPELTQAFTVLNRAEVDQSIANNNVWRALLLKAAAIGDLSIFLEQIAP